MWSAMNRFSQGCSGAKRKRASAAARLAYRLVGRDANASRMLGRTRAARCSRDISGMSSVNTPPSRAPCCCAHRSDTKPPNEWPTITGGTRGVEQAFARCDGHRLVGHRLHRIAGAPVRAAHAAERQRRHAVGGGEERRDEAPPLRVRHLAVQQQQAGQAAFAPGERLDARALHVVPAARGLNGQRIAEPTRWLGHAAAERRQRCGQRRRVVRRVQRTAAIARAISLRPCALPSSGTVWSRRSEMASNDSARRSAASGPAPMCRPAVNVM